jgi:hypothetical protein
MNEANYWRKHVDRLQARVVELENELKERPALSTEDLLTLVYRTDLRVSDKALHDRLKGAIPVAWFPSLTGKSEQGR